MSSHETGTLTHFAEPIAFYPMLPILNYDSGTTRESALCDGRDHVSVFANQYGNVQRKMQYGAEGIKKLQ